jgi:hypothetical protein
MGLSRRLRSLLLTLPSGTARELSHPAVPRSIPTPRMHWAAVQSMRGTAVTEGEYAAPAVLSFGAPQRRQTMVALLPLECPGVMSIGRITPPRKDDSWDGDPRSDVGVAQFLASAFAWCDSHR